MTRSIGRLTFSSRHLLLLSALAAWLFAGFILAVPPLAATAAVEAMGVTDEALRGRWFSWYVAAFLLGAATGGLLFGWMGDRFGRAKALGASVLTYSLVAGCCYFVGTPEQLLVLWFLACTGVGGAWPNAVSLTTEALPGVSRPWLAGLFGCTVNLGLVLISVIADIHRITVDDWRWVMLVCAMPAVLGVFVLAFVPESPAWLAASMRVAGEEPRRSSTIEVFRPPLLRYTLIGIVLGAIPLMGSWGSTNWAVPWSRQAQKQAGGQGLDAKAQWTKSAGAVIGSLLGGWFANLCGRRTAYFLISLFSLGTSFYVFRWLSPLDNSFLTWLFIQGFISTIYFGWLPLYLPELFPTRVRATGTGVSYNWGRAATAVGVLLSGQLLYEFGGNYARIGQWTCLVYGLGMVVICFAPDTTVNRLETESLTGV